MEKPLRSAAAAPGGRPASVPLAVPVPEALRLSGAKGRSVLFGSGPGRIELCRACGGAGATNEGGGTPSFGTASVGFRVGGNSIVRNCVRRIRRRHGLAKRGRRAFLWHTASGEFGAGDETGDETNEEALRRSAAHPQCRAADSGPPQLSTKPRRRRKSRALPETTSREAPSPFGFSRGRANGGFWAAPAGGDVGAAAAAAAAEEEEERREESRRRTLRPRVWTGRVCSWPMRGSFGRRPGRRRTYLAHGRIGKCASRPAHVKFVLSKRKTGVERGDDEKEGEGAQGRKIAKREAAKRRFVAVGGGSD